MNENIQDLYNEDYRILLRKSYYNFLVELC